MTVRTAAIAAALLVASVLTVAPRAQVVVSQSLTALGVTAAAQTVLDDATVAAMVDTLGGATSTGTGGLVRATSPTFTTSLITPAITSSGARTDLFAAESSITTATSNTLTVTSGTGVVDYVFSLINLTAPVMTARVVTSGTAATVANVGANSCGTSAASLAGNDNAGAVTVGATSGTQCRITFTAAAGTRRHCTASNETTAALARAVYVDASNTDLLGTFTAADVVSYVCFAR